MKILCLCQEGNNRSVVFAHQLRYWGHDVLTGGLRTNTMSTLNMLCGWADVIILTERGQDRLMPLGYEDKVKLFDVGPDAYPRPFNMDLLTKVQRYLQDNKAWLKQTK